MHDFCCILLQLIPDLLQIVPKVYEHVRYLKIDGLLVLQADDGTFRCSFSSILDWLTVGELAHLFIYETISASDDSSHARERRRRDRG